MAETVVVAGVTYTIPDPGDSPNWATGLTPYLVAIAANVASNPTFIQYVAVAATPTTAISGKCYLITTASLAITMNLPAPVQNAWFMFKDVSNNAASNNITLHRNGSEQIDGVASDKALARSGGTWVVMCDGTNWWTINPYAHSGTDAGLVAADYAAGSISNAAINASAAIAVSKLAALTASKVVTTDGSGFLTTTNDPLPIARGGTNSGTTLNNNRFVVSTGSALVEAGAVGASRAVVSDTNGLPAASATTSTQVGYLPNLFLYRRPVLQYSSTTVVNLETGTGGVAGSATIVFPDGQLISDSTAGHINCNMAQVASTGASPQSGVRTGSVANNTWYAIYAVKANSAANFVTIADTVLPLIANLATLNSNFGGGSWVYLGMIRCGDGASAISTITKFNQAGNTTLFRNTESVPGTSVPHPGLLLATTAGATSLTWAYSAGTSGAVLPNNVGLVQFSASVGSSSGSMAFQDSAGSYYYEFMVSAGPVNTSWWVPPSEGAKVGAPSSVAIEIFLSGFVDVALGGGYNPLF